MDLNINEITYDKRGGVGWGEERRNGFQNCTCHFVQKYVKRCKNIKHYGQMFWNGRISEA